jgi:small subunit ribosomal protein S8
VKYPESERPVGKKMQKKTMKYLRKTNYQIGDFLIRLKNAAMAKNKSVSFASTNKIVALAEGLKKMGYISEVKKEKELVTVTLAYKNKLPLIQDVKLVSKPGLRVYKSVAEIQEKKSPSIYVISSPKGIVSTMEAVKLRMGGEIIAEIW